MNDKYILFYFCYSDEFFESNIIFEYFLDAQIIEILDDRDFLIEAFSPPCLDHKLPGQLMMLMHLQGPQHNLLIQGIPWQQLPMIKQTQTKRLPNRMHPQIRLKPQRLNTRYQRLNNIM